jgi:uncharacterized protein HemX
METNNEPTPNVNANAVMDIQPPQATPSTSNPQSSETEPVTPANPKKSRPPIMVIIIAIIVALTMAGLTVFVYLKTKDTPSLKQASKQSQQDKATSADVESATQSIDESMKSVDEASDFNDTELSDSNLGL